MTRFLVLVILIVALSPLLASDPPFPSLGVVSVPDKSSTDPPAGNADGEPHLVPFDGERSVDTKIVLTGSLEADFPRARAFADRAAAAGAPHVSDELLRAQLLAVYICDIDGRRMGCDSPASN